MVAGQIQHTQRVCEAIAHVAAIWLVPDSPWMRRAEQEIPRHTPYSPQMVRACLESTFLGYDTKSLWAWVKRDFRSSSSSSTKSKVLVLLPSTVFAVAWQVATAAWLAGVRVIFKPSRREPLFAKLLKKSVLSEAGSILPIETWNVGQRIRNFHQHDAIIIFGNDETIRRLETLPTIHHRLLSFGTKVSVAYVNRKSLTGVFLHALISRAAWDAVLYETQGCLSPQCFYVEEGGKISPERFAEKLAAAMEELDASLPPRITEEDRWAGESFWQRWRFRESQGRAHIFGRHVVFHRESHFEPCGLKRVVFVTSLRRASGLADHLGLWRERLSTIAVSDGMFSKGLSVSFGLGQMDGVRFCKIGQMHQPPPGWRNGGISLLRELKGS